MTRTLSFLLLLLMWLPHVNGQPTLSFDLKKPQKYENRKLGSEKTEEKKFGLVRRFMQNGTTKFNWHFNAAKKLDEIIARAKAMNKDDYARLLPFYNYSLDQTKRDKIELDSVIYKANAGILIHDLRNSWVDNLYMLMGMAYYFRKELDSAYFSFQYINYAFSPKEKDGYDKPIGSNANEGGNAFSISTKENTSVVKKIWARPPSRNESFIWQIRTFLAKDEMPEAAGLIETLKHDPFFPERLKTDLREMQAWWFYKQQMYDSSAIYLEQALDNAENREERSRWEYLIGQLYERAGKHEQAAEFFERTVNHTLNPVLEVYARLNAIRQHKGDEKVIQENINELSKMARKDRYLAYRDIIYYAAAEMELERNNVPGAKAFLLKATRSGTPGSDNGVRNKAFLLLGDLSFKEKNYYDAKRFYDSITNLNPSIADPAQLNKLKSALARIVEQQMIINRQDSLQRLAAMPDEEREALLKKMVKQMRRQQGLKEEDNGGASGGPLSFNNSNDNAPSDLFSNSAKGDWYFDNPGLKAKGFSDFRGTWGNRPNVDNWQRLGAIKQSNPQLAAGNGAPDDAGKAGATPAGPATYDDLLKQIPLTPEKLKVSNDSIETAQFMLGKAYLDGLEDYPSTINTLEAFLARFPNSTKRPAALFMLAYCYSKTGDTEKEKAVRDELKQKYSGTTFEKIISSPNGVTPDSIAKTDMTRRYDTIYNLFIEGNFDEALAQKKTADSLYSNNYWTPQLLYIQSVYYIRQRQDDTAKKTLQDIIRLYPTSPLAGRAKAIIDVLGRRAQIEDYLTKLKIERPADDSTAEPTAVIAPVQQPVTLVTQSQPPPVIGKKDTTQAKQPVINKPQQPPATVAKKDTAQQTVAKTGKPPVTTPPAVTPGQPQQQPVVAKKDTTQAKQPAAPKPLVLSKDAAAPHYVAIILNKVDPVYINEARNAFIRYNRESFSSKGYSVNNTAISDDIKLVLIGGFENADAAIDYIGKTRKLAASEIIPWLPANKYSFIILTDNNLEVLKNTKDVEAYKTFMMQSFPGKF